MRGSVVYCVHFRWLGKGLRKFASRQGESCSFEYFREQSGCQRKYSHEHNPAKRLFTNVHNEQTFMPSRSTHRKSRRRRVYSTHRLHAMENDERCTLSLGNELSSHSVSVRVSVGVEIELRVRLSDRIVKLVVFAANNIHAGRPGSNCCNVRTKDERLHFACF